MCMGKNEENKMCQGCVNCAPYDYSIEVDASFLTIMEQALNDLHRLAKNHTAPGWFDMIKNAKKRMEEKYNQKFFN